MQAEVRSGMKHARLTLVACVVAWCSLGVAAAADNNDPHQWLERMSTSLSQLNYEGVFVYRHDDQMAAIRITHTVGKDGERERLETLTGAANAVERSGGGAEKWALAGDDGSAETLSVTRQLSEIGKFYEFSMAGLDRTAGRPTRLIVVKPRDMYRYGYRLWLDEQTALLLKSDLLDEKGRVLEQVMFTSISVGGPARSATGKGARREGKTTAQTLPVTSPANSRWQVRQVPQGFVLVDHQPMSAQKPVEHIMYTDGLASVSVFIEAAKQAAKVGGNISRMGAVSAYVNRLNNHQVTVVGEVPVATVRMIGNSVSERR